MDQGTANINPRGDEAIASRPKINAETLLNALNQVEANKVKFRDETATTVISGLLEKVLTTHI